jgi:hypothetical protein
VALLRGDGLAELEVPVWLRPGSRVWRPVDFLSGVAHFSSCDESAGLVLGAGQDVQHSLIDDDVVALVQPLETALDEALQPWPYGFSKLFVFGKVAAHLPADEVEDGMNRSDTVRGRHMRVVAGRTSESSKDLNDPPLREAAPRYSCIGPGVEDDAVDAFAAHRL